LTLSLLALACLMASAQATEIRTQRFEPYFDYAPGDAAKEYSLKRKEIEEAYKKEMKRSTCEIAGEKVPCLAEGYERVFLPPFVPILPSNLDDDFVDGLVPVNEVLGGDSVLGGWWHKAHAGRSYGCEGDGECRVLVHTPNKGLAECRITKTSAGLGAPKYCRLVAVRENGAWYLNAIVNWDRRSPNLGRRDFDIAVEGRIQDRVGSIYKIMTLALASEPLYLSVEQQSNGDVVGIASYRASTVLKGWREIVTIRLQVEAEVDKFARDHTSKALRVYVISTLYVNRQNTDKPSDWSLPTRMQESLWMNAVRSNLKQALPRLCKVSSWKDDKTIVCQ